MARIFSLLIAHRDTRSWSHQKHFERRTVSWQMKSLEIHKNWPCINYLKLRPQASVLPAGMIQGDSYRRKGHHCTAQHTKAWAATK